jgi:hypothetical protein
LNDVLVEGPTTVFFTLGAVALAQRNNPRFSVWLSTRFVALVPLCFSMPYSRSDPPQRSLRTNADSLSNRHVEPLDTLFADYLTGGSPDRIGSWSGPQRADFLRQDMDHVPNLSGRDMVL